jgi:hypothetical protein
MCVYSVCHLHYLPEGLSCKSTVIVYDEFCIGEFLPMLMYHNDFSVT